MAKYEVIHFFTDLLDDNYAYHIGDIYPRKGVIASKERIEELKSDKNKRGMPLIKAKRTPRQKEE